MALLQLSTAGTRMFFLGAGLAGVASTISKAGGAFAPAAGGAPAAVGVLGWYKQALTVADTNTLGDLAYHFVAGVGVPAPQTADQVANWFTTTRVNADVQSWLTAVPAALNATGLVQVDVLRAVNVLLAAPTAGGFLQTDVALWKTATPSNLDAAGLVQVDVLRAVNVALAAPTVGGFLRADVALWKTATPSNLDAAGLVVVDVFGWMTLPVVPPTAAGNIQVDVEQWVTAAPAALDAAGLVQVDVVRWLMGVVAATTGVGLIKADVIDWDSVPISAVTPEVDLINAPNATAVTAFATGLLSLANGLVTGFTTKQALRLVIAALYGKSSVAGTTRIFRNVEDTVDAITATVDVAGQRLVVILDPS